MLNLTAVIGFFQVFLKSMLTVKILKQIQKIA